MIYKKKVKKLVEKLEKELTEDKILNLRYIDQNFLMRKEMLLEKQRKEKSNKKKPDSESGPSPKKD